MHVGVQWISVAARLSVNAISTEPLVILYVGNYLLDHENIRFRSQSNDFHKNGGHFTFFETL